MNGRTFVTCVNLLATALSAHAGVHVNLGKTKM